MATKEDAIAYKRALKALHLCVDCKGQDAYTLNGRWVCAECAEKRAAYMRNWRAGTDYGHRLWEKRKVQEWERREQGVCYKCGRKLDDKRYKTCWRCRAQDRKYKDMRHRSKTPQWLRGKDGRCYRCNERPCEPGFKTCPECHAKLAAQMKINRSKGDNKKHPWRDLDNAVFHMRKGNDNGERMGQGDAQRTADV